MTQEGAFSGTAAGQSILIADDQPMNLSVLSGMFRDRGFHVRSVTNGRKALDAARKALPDLIMLDISMPELDGYQACLELKADPALAEVPVIFISAHDQPLDKVRAFQVGGADYVQKPFHLEEVLARVQHQLRIRALQGELLARNRDLEEANLGLRELDRLKASFTAMLVHDLKSPLSGLRLALEDALESGTVRPRLVEAANAQVDKVIAYLNELLDVFRAESQGMELVEEDLSSGSLLEGIAEDFRPQADRKGIELRVTLPPGLPSLKADARKLERAFNNLLANALKFTPEGGIIGLRASVQEGNGLDAGIRWLSVELADSGRGIPAEKLPLIFNPYHQAFHSDSDSGTGLGLAIVARIVAAHHGRIQVQSREAVGSCFTILLPLQPDDQTPTQPDP